MNKGILDMKLYKLSKVYNENNEIDPTLVNATFIILKVDGVSGNNQIITKEEALKMANSMKLKPLTCQYFKTTNYNTPNDHFGGHGVYKEKFRKGGKEYLATDSFAIGVAPEGCRLETIDKDGEQIEVLMCDYVLWMARYPNIVSLIDEMFQNRIDLFSSCEYLYSNFEVKNGITYPKDLIFDGHCLLGQKPNGTKVEPAFEVSKLLTLNEQWNKAVSEVLDKEVNSKEVDDLKTVEELLKMYCELSHEGIRNKLYTALSEKLTASEFNSIWISHYDIFSNYFLYESWNSEEEKYDYYKVNFTKNEDDTLTVDVEGRQKVERQMVWVTVNELEKVQNEKIEVEGKVSDLEKTINEKDEAIKTLNSTVETLTTEKEEVVKQFNSATESIVDLTKQVNEMKPIVDTYNNEQYEKTLNEQKERYEEKFIALNAKDKFESEEVQQLIVKSLNSTEEGEKAKLQINSMLVELVVPSKGEKHIKEFNSKMENLIPVNTDFDSRYGIKY